MAAKKIKKPIPKVNPKKFKGNALYNYLLKEVGKESKRNKDIQTPSFADRRKIVKDQLLQKYKEEYKKNGKVSLRAIKNDIKVIVSELPSIDECNPLLLPPEDLTEIEFYAIDEHIRKLPSCLDIMINGGEFGFTGIFNTDNYDYVESGVQDIVEAIREITENESGKASFTGVVKLKNKAKNNGKAENYYIEYVLFLNEEPVSDANPVPHKYTKKERDKQKKIGESLNKRIAGLKKEKPKEIPTIEPIEQPIEQPIEVPKVKTTSVGNLQSLLSKIRETPTTKVVPIISENVKKVSNVDAIEKAIDSYQNLLNLNLITVKEFNKQKNKLLKLKK